MTAMRTLLCIFTCMRVQANPYGGWDYVGCKHQTGRKHDRHAVLRGRDVRDDVLDDRAWLEAKAMTDIDKDFETVRAVSPEDTGDYRAFHTALDRIEAAYHEQSLVSEHWEGLWRRAFVSVLDLQARVRELEARRHTTYESYTDRIAAWAYAQGYRDYVQAADAEAEIEEHPITPQHEVEVYALLDRIAELEQCVADLEAALRELESEPSDMTLVLEAQDRIDELEATLRAIAEERCPSSMHGDSEKIRYWSQDIALRVLEREA